MAAEETQHIRPEGIEELDRKSLKWGILLFFVLILQVSLSGWYVVSDKQVYYSIQLMYAMEYIDVFYPDEFDKAKMMSHARRAVLDELDRFSGYIEPKEMNLIREEFSGSYGGIGITIIQHDSGLLITSVRDDGPAGKAGLHTGDIIIGADSVNLSDFDAHDATFVLRGPEGSKVEIKVVRDMYDTLKYEMTRQNLPLIHIPYAGLTAQKNLYIRLTDFEAGASAGIAQTLDTLFLPHKDSIGGIILDLRGNPGGLLNEAITIADLFLDPGILIVGTKGRSRWVNEENRSITIDITEGKPLVLLVDKFSASASEIIAGSLKYAGRAVLVGDTTFGKGLVQEYKGFTDGSGMRLTRSRYYFEGNKFINDPNAEIIDSAAGIPPDYYVDFPNDDPFIRELENTFLLREFAVLHAEDITRYSPFVEKSPDWLEQFKRYAHDNGFHYASKTTMMAAITRSMIAFEGYSDKTFRTIDGILKKSQEQDRNLIDDYSDYIRQRLFQIALENTEGTHESYRLAVLPYRKDIVLAEKIIEEKKR